MTKEEKHLFEELSRVLRKITGATPDFIRVTAVISLRDDDGSEAFEDQRRMFFNCCHACAAKQLDDAVESLDLEMSAAMVVDDLLRGLRP